MTLKIFFAFAALLSSCGINQAPQARDECSRRDRQANTLVRCIDEAVVATGLTKKTQPLIEDYNKCLLHIQDSLKKSKADLSDLFGEQGLGSFFAWLRKSTPRERIIGYSILNSYFDPNIDIALASGSIAANSVERLRVEFLTFLDNEKEHRVHFHTFRFTCARKEPDNNFHSLELSASFFLLCDCQDIINCSKKYKSLSLVRYLYIRTAALFGSCGYWDNRLALNAEDANVQVLQGILNEFEEWVKSTPGYSFIINKKNGVIRRSVIVGPIVFPLFQVLNCANDSLSRTLSFFRVESGFRIHFDPYGITYKQMDRVRPFCDWSHNEPFLPFRDWSRFERCEGEFLRFRYVPASTNQRVRD